MDALAGRRSNAAFRSYRKTACASVAVAALAILAVIAASTLLPGLVALAVGHAPAVESPRPQTRWRFTSGGALGNGVVQMIAMAMTVSSVFSMSLWFLVPAVGAWLISVWWYGSKLERALS